MACEETTRPIFFSALIFWFVLYQDKMNKEHCLKDDQSNTASIQICTPKQSLCSAGKILNASFPRTALTLVRG